MTSRVRRHALGMFGGMAAASLLGLVATSTRSMDGSQQIDLAAAIPTAFGSWKLDPLATAFVRPTDELANRIYQQLLERTYIDHVGRRVMLSIAYGRQQSSGLEVHLPEICYRFGGFTVSGRHVADVQFPGQRARVTRLVAELPLRPEVITYWIVLGGERIPDGNTYRLRRLANAVRRESADGVLVRVSSLDIDPDRAFALQLEFINEMLAAMRPADRAHVTGTSLDALQSKA
jgi:EpsI family protein